MALFSADDITYPPLDVPKPVADGVWIVAHRDRLSHNRSSAPDRDGRAS
jgi:hypothetical protein